MLAAQMRSGQVVAFAQMVDKRCAGRRFVGDLDTVQSGAEEGSCGGLPCRAQRSGGVKLPDGTLERTSTRLHHL